MYEFVFTFLSKIACIIHQLESFFQAFLSLKIQADDLSDHWLLKYFYRQ